ncbi:MAG: winged helix-turn-helix transcriptional regulator [Deinococcales bacterium]|nr:winged helix-turn-helix transcriptional regulator [Chitinophagaceae bacterium]
MQVLTERVTASKLIFASNMLKVIAHPVRLAIVDALYQAEKLTVLEIQEKLYLDQPIASQHLTLMQDKGVLTSEKVGRNRFFKLKYPDMFKIINCLENCCNTI